jgi:lipopolysaccharide export system permease protein
MLLVLTMQFFWLYMDELIGKGLGVGLILQLLMYMSTTLVPLALPLAVLLASIMTFGTLGENYELVALKSAGISLNRIMRPLLVFMIFISGLAFLFSNNIIPVANLKAYTLLYNLRNSKLTLSIREGRFNNEIEGYAIRVGKKSKDGKKISDIIIYDNTAGIGNDKIIIAKSGEMFSSENKRYLIFRLFDGWRYEEALNGRNGEVTHSQIRMQFKQADKIFDMSSFKMQSTDEESMKGGQAMMNISQLNDQSDTTILRKELEYKRYVNEINTNFTLPFGTEEKYYQKIDSVVAVRNENATETISYQTIPDSLKRQVIEYVESQVRGQKLNIEVAERSIDIYDSQLNNYKIEWHRKFSLSFACILLYLIGAPLGAIIRKGGIGLPLVIAVIFFVAYFITSKSGETLSETKELPPYIGMWISTLMLLPFAFFFIRSARTDSKLFSKEWYVRIWKLLVSKFQKPA